MSVPTHSINSPNLLQNLRDIHLPPPISVWPQTLGWYLLLALLVVSIMYGSIKLYHYTMRRSYQKKLMSELHRLVALYTDSPVKSLENISIFMRCIALAMFPREDVAGLKGEAWLRFLDQQGEAVKRMPNNPFNHQFSQGVGRVLLEGPYQKEIQTDIKALLLLIEHWIKQVVGNKR